MKGEGNSFKINNKVGTVSAPTARSSRHLPIVAGTPQTDQNMILHCSLRPHQCYMLEEVSTTVHRTLLATLIGLKAVTA